MRTNKKRTTNLKRESVQRTRERKVIQQRHFSKQQQRALMGCNLQLRTGEALRCANLDLNDPKTFATWTPWMWTSFSYRSQPPHHSPTHIRNNRQAPPSPNKVTWRNCAQQQQQQQLTHALCAHLWRRFTTSTRCSFHLTANPLSLIRKEKNTQITYCYIQPLCWSEWRQKQKVYKHIYLRLAQ